MWRQSPRDHCYTALMDRFTVVLKFILLEKVLKFSFGEKDLKFSLGEKGLKVSLGEKV